MTTETKWVGDLEHVCNELERLGAVLWEPWPRIDETKAPAALVGLYRSLVQVGYSQGWSVNS